MIVLSTGNAFQTSKTFQKSSSICQIHLEYYDKSKTGNVTHNPWVSVDGSPTHIPVAGLKLIFWPNRQEQLNNPSDSFKCLDCSIMLSIFRQDNHLMGTDELDRRPGKEKITMALTKFSFSSQIIKEIKNK